MIVGTTLMPIVAGMVADRAGLVADLLIPVGCQAVLALLILGTRETAPRVVARSAIASQPA